jgi:L-threonylcarbamoyladenylate synthase
LNPEIEKAVRLLNQNEVVAIPTETVYGLAGNALNEQVVAKIFAIKQRPFFDPLIIHTYSVHKISDYASDIPEKAFLLLEKFTPGPITVLLKKKKIIPDLVTSGSDLVAIRIPNHDLTLKLLELVDFPLAAPSANPFGYISPTSAEHVSKQLGNKIPFILDGGECKIGLESTIVGFENEKINIYRLGGLSIEAIEDTLNQKVIIKQSTSQPNAPGMLDRHYSPKKPFILGNIEEELIKFKNKKVGILSFSTKYFLENAFQLSAKKDFIEAASNLFKLMRQLDDSDVDVILAELVPNENLGKAINDRLKRAAARY